MSGVAARDRELQRRLLVPLERARQPAAHELARRGIEVGSVTLHPSGIPHGPHPGLAEKSIGQTETHELAVMCDTFHPLRLTKLAKKLDDGEYAYSWLEERVPAAGDADEDPAGVTSHF